MSLMLLDERTEWSDLAEQCVSIPRIAVGKDLREARYPFCFVLIVLSMAQEYAML